MKWLLLLLATLSIDAFPSSTHDIKIESRYVSNKDKLREVWGVDPEARKERLQRIFDKSATDQNATNQAEIQEQLKKIVAVKNISKLEDDNLNEKSGIADYFYQGDINFSEKQFQMLERNQTGRSKRQVYAFADKWTNNKVYFYFDPAYNVESQRQSIRDVLKYISASTCIDFEESSTAPNRVRVFNGGGCFSDLGMSGGEQGLSIADWCLSLGSIGHEFAHALGFIHEHSRSDRDDYVIVNTDNVLPQYKSQFSKYSPNSNLLLAPFEYGSFMQYGANFFTANGELTIIPKDMKYLHTMSNKQVTFYDFTAINSFYECDAKCPAATSAKCQNGGKPNPRNCAVCYCPGGYGGALCEQRPPGCGESLTAQANWQRAQFVMGNKADMNVYAIPTFCNSWITAPAGKQIEVSILAMDNTQCMLGCQYIGFEVKAEDKVKTNPRYCCPEFNNRPIRSTLNPTPVIGYNRYTGSSFLYEYRYVDAGTPDFTEYLVPLKRFYKPSGGFHRFHTNEFYERLWTEDGMTLEGGLGAVLSAGLYEQNKAKIDAQCGSLVLLRSFFNPYMVLTPDAGFANALKNTGWTELPYVGYCSSTPTCGASRPLRSVSAVDGSTSVYSTDSNEIDTLNTFDRFKGTASGILCYLF